MATFKTVVFAAVFWIIGGGSASAEEVALAAMEVPVWTVGCTWTHSDSEVNAFLTMSLGNFVTSVSGVAEDGSATIVVDNGREPTQTKGVRSVPTGNTMVKFSFPLFEGKEWSYQLDRAGIHFDITAKVTGPVQVTVPAGTFSAFKVDFAQKYHRGDGFTGTVSDTWWVSPQVKGYVLREYRDSGSNRGALVRELLNYTCG